VEAPPTTALEPGQPRSAADAEFLERFDRAMRLPIVAAALLPLVVMSESTGWIPAVVELATWPVFLVDYLVHARHRHRYWRTPIGVFDLAVVVITAPWFLLPGAHSGRFVALLRLARLARVLEATRGSRRLFERLGRVTFVAAGILVVASMVAYHAEHPTNPEFATFSDSLWWGIVTLTTVGYGDVVPITTSGRWAAVVIMITGIAVLGTLAGTLASFFRGGDGEQRRTAPLESSGATSAQRADVPDLAALTSEVSELRQQIERLTERLGPPARSDAGEDASA
jgi:voltage-gated potassium channel